ncbi:MFS transporter [Gryllotalpicola protaetiae]|nr:MFS transporter [Gryllotalpicola protaetiae]
MLSRSSQSVRRTLPAPAAFAAAIASFAAFFMAAGAPTPLLIVEQRQWGFSSASLTLAFGIYAIGLLLALLTVGGLSDYVGRRPVLIGALVLETVAFMVMLAATGIEAVVVARLIQGIATGAATSAFSSAVFELAPPRARAIAASVVSAAPAGGLGLGALVAGALARWSARPDAIMWGGLAIVTVLGAVAMSASPETIAPRRGALDSLRPTISLPADVRAPFRRAAPTLVAAWMMAALYMGLVPTILGAAFGIRSTFVDGATAFLEPAAAAAATLLSARFAPRTLLRAAAVTTSLGAVVFLAGLAAGALWLLDVAGLVGGVGFGASMAAAIRSTIPGTPAQRRAGVFAAIYTVSYLAFGVPTIVSGRLAGVFGLMPVVVVLASVIAVLAAAGLAVTSRAGEPGAARTPRRGRRAPTPQ